MNHTEKIVVEVSPESEGERLVALQAFGWDLQSRKDVQPIRPMLVNEFGMDEAPVILSPHPTAELTFVRDLFLPNLLELRRLELEYDHLPRPELPGLAGPGALMAIAVLLAIPALLTTGQAAGIGLGLCVVAFAAGMLWAAARRDERNIARSIRNASERRGQEILARARVLAHSVPIGA